MAVWVEQLFDGYLSSVTGIDERGSATPSRDEQFAAFRDVLAMRRDRPEQVLHEEAAPQHRPRHGRREQGLLDLVVRDEPRLVRTEHRHVDDVPQPAFSAARRNGSIAVRAALLAGRGKRRNNSRTPSSAAGQVEESKKSNRTA
ncbi:hypothetical protein [Lentzea pudingi]|uniref:hypothetical protein n=1 Tax=Lentzea pudingi TaxID=1789439 RepID=UPI00402B15BD